MLFKKGIERKDPLRTNSMIKEQEQCCKYTFVFIRQSPTEILFPVLKSGPKYRPQASTHVLNTSALSLLWLAPLVTHFHVMLNREGNIHIAHPHWTVTGQYTKNKGVLLRLLTFCRCERDQQAKKKECWWSIHKKAIETYPIGRQICPSKIR